MTVDHAEGIFAVVMQVPKTPGRRNAIRDAIVQHRVLADARIDHAMLHDRDARRRLALEKRAHAAVHLGAGAGVGQVTAPELLFGDPLPACDRWGDVVSVQQGMPDAPMHTLATLGQRQRPTLPHALGVAPGDRVGPHGTIEVQLKGEQASVVSYHDVLSRLEACALGQETMDRGTAAHVGVALERDDDDDDGNDGDDATMDVAADQEDGARVWPPRALRAGPATDVAKLMARVAAHVDRHMAPALTTGSAHAALYWEACRARLDDTDVLEAARRDFCGLGVCGTSQDRTQLARHQHCALYVAMAAYVQGNATLGEAAWTLAGTVAKCATV